MLVPHYRAVPYLCAKTPFHPRLLDFGTFWGFSRRPLTSPPRRRDARRRSYFDLGRLLQARFYLVVLADLSPAWRDGDTCNFNETVVVIFGRPSFRYLIFLPTDATHASVSMRARGLNWPRQIVGSFLIVERESDCTARRPRMMMRPLPH